MSPSLFLQNNDVRLLVYFGLTSLNSWMTCCEYKQEISTSDSQPWVTVPGTADLKRTVTAVVEGPDDSLIFATGSQSMDRTLDNKTAIVEQYFSKSHSVNVLNTSNHFSHVSHLVMASNGNLIAAVNNGEVYQFDFNTSQWRSLTGDRNWNSPVQSMAITADGLGIVVGLKNNFVFYGTLAHASSADSALACTWYQLHDSSWGYPVNNILVNDPYIFLGLTNGAIMTFKIADLNQDNPRITSLMGVGWNRPVNAMKIIDGNLVVGLGLEYLPRLQISGSVMSLPLSKIPATGGSLTFLDWVTLKDQSWYQPVNSLVGIDGDIYVGLGNDGQVEKYSNSAWSEIRTKNDTGGCGVNQMCVTTNGALIVGYGPDNLLIQGGYGEVVQYDPVQNKWTTLRSKTKTLGGPAPKITVMLFSATNHLVIAFECALGVSSGVQILDQRLFGFNPNLWMHDCVDNLGDVALGSFCIAGSHDSGMSEVNESTLGSNACNTQTQTNGFLNQLNLGIRYFDIRPMIVRDKDTKAVSYYTTAHFTKFPIVNGLGSYGQSIASMIKDVNSFTSVNQELVILDVSHAYTGTALNDFGQSDWDAFLSVLCDSSKGLKHLFATTATDFTTLSLKSFIYQGKLSVPAVVVLVPNGITIPSNLANKGVYPSSVLNIYNDYSGANTVDAMASDQLAKMKQHAKDYFLLSWTLTQDTSQTVMCAAGDLDNDLVQKLVKLFWSPTSIRQLADRANIRLGSFIYSNVSPSVYPKIIFIDNIVSTQAAAVAVSLTYLFVKPKLSSTIQTEAPSLNFKTA